VGLVPALSFPADAVKADPPWQHRPEVPTAPICELCRSTSDSAVLAVDSEEFS
jgi:hypothetical protein